MNKNTANNKRVKPRNKTADIIAFILLLGIAITIGISIKNSLDLSLIKYATVENGQVVESIEGQALILREEQLIAAPAGGQFKPTLSEGARVKLGSTVGYMEQESGKKINVYASNTGIVSYMLDGKEGLAQRDILHELDLAKLLSLFDPQNQTDDKDKKLNINNDNLGKGRSVCKVIDNLLNYTLIVAIDPNNELPEKKSLKFFVPKRQDGQEQVEQSPVFSAKVIDTVEDIAKKYVILEFLPKEDFFSQDRYFTVNLIQESFSGQIIPASAIVNQADGSSGVYKRYKKRLSFVKIEVIGIIEDQAAVSGLSVGDKVVINPQILTKKQKSQITL
ncbi:MAG: HlyD family efflux transporter periplasmic adaptor subunit [Bacillota bacterium]|jgi:hypothetical protein